MIASLPTDIQHVRFIARPVRFVQPCCCSHQTSIWAYEPNRSPMSYPVQNVGPTIIRFHGLHLFFCILDLLMTCLFFDVITPQQSCQYHPNSDPVWAILYSMRSRRRLLLGTQEQSFHVGLYSHTNTSTLSGTRDR
jgi:hypothetical protein